LELLFTFIYLKTIYETKKTSVGHNFKPYNTYLCPSFFEIMSLNKHSYKIAFVGLKTGLHQFSYSLNNSFFEQFSQSPVKNAAIEVILLFDKKNNFFELTFKLDGWINTLCDRCIEDYKLEIMDDHKLFVKFESHQQPQSVNEDVIYFNRNETHLDVTQFLYEFTVLSMPIKKSCKLKANGLPECEKELGEYFNNTNAPEEKAIDPRWEALKKLNK